ncbi:ABC transporter ATP-binding protein/permease [Tessaracoccus sp. MC1679]|uniref:ABC transporter ATP-binding protein/permease n=1 Tax=Tessaracoccus sp. MC1679 TaxID=2760313 RepID=UPI001602869E|nr:ABC transporter ATP-binding protein/permease [Tessaracoccus sp. MC1679]MBB1516647.1 ABC transporter ATP-binding protein/permease [Tessaracoccus sp. MC1679]
MLQLEKVRKSYTTGDFTQVALDDVSIAFRDNEFVAILGPSGSGKTTLLNVVGGLDHYDSGNLVIDGIPTDEYRDRDWDTYRNNRIGFVFQAYNLIPHQSVLSNVELALTLAGVSPSERKRRAMAALSEVGLAEHVHKRPNQLSGGQMQRVAIARALINDPDILLADEPTGALDTATSVQIMALLTDIARDRLVIMVTHNPELAKEYATRTVQLRDGVVFSDTDPYQPEQQQESGRPARRTSMSFLTAIALSFNNLMTKKGRTLMTSFAGSIGIIGIAAILALANGVGLYIKGVEEDTLSMYPLSIERQGFDLTSLLAGSPDGRDDDAPEPVEGEVPEAQRVSRMLGGVGTNDLASLKRYFDDGDSGIDDFVNSIEYSYDVTPRIYAETREGPRQVNPDTTFNSVGLDPTSTVNSLLGPGAGSGVFSELVEDLSLVETHYEVLAGDWPDDALETVVVLSPSGRVSDLTLYAMGLRDPAELDVMVTQLANEEPITEPGAAITVTYDDLLAATFRLVNVPDLYSYDAEFGVWTDRSSDEGHVASVVDSAETLEVVGVVQAVEDSTILQSGIYYTPALTRHVIEKAAGSEIVADQLARSDTNVLTGRSFADDRAAAEEMDLSQLISFDQDAIAGAFTFDADALEIDTSALENLSLPEFALDPSSLPELDLAALLGELDLASVVAAPDMGAEAGQVVSWTTSLATSFAVFVTENQLDPADTEANFRLFLQSPTGQQLLVGTVQEPRPLDAETLAGLLEALLGFAATPLQPPSDAPEQPAPAPSAPSPGAEARVEAFLSSEQGQAALAATGGLIDPEALVAAAQAYDRFVEQAQPATDEQPDVAALVRAFLDSPQGLDLLTRLGATPPGQAPAAEAPGEEAGLLTQLVRGYLAYTVDNGLPIDGVEANLDGFLASPQGADLLAAAGDLIDTDALTAQLQGAMGSYIADVMGELTGALSTQLADALGTQVSAAIEGSMGRLSENMADAMSIDEAVFADAFQLNRNQDELTQLLMAMTTRQLSSYEGNLRTLGFADLTDPSTIQIFPKDFESKERVLDILDAYNASAKEAGDEDRVITFTDIVGALMGSVTDIINTISYVLVAFVAISLVVSSIMIGVITYISVLERKKEIGILRSIGASKRDIRRVFNAETLIVGFVAGLLGVVVTFLLTIPANAIVEANFDVPNVAQLPLQAAVILVLVSMGLTALAGLIPASAASRKDPVEALRSE